MTQPLLDVRDLRKHFVTRTGRLSRARKVVKAVDGVSFTVGVGETLGLVGESGCGKSTLARTVLFLELPTSGEILFEGGRVTEGEAKRLRRRAQIVFQDPYASLPPRMRIEKILADPLAIHGLADRAAIPERVVQLLRDVGLGDGVARKLPHQLSGGQRQRVGIARALSVQPSLIVADEAVSSLDASVRAQILNLLKDIQERQRLSYLFVSHDLGVVKYMSHRIAVMYLGEIVELAPADPLYERPLHPYTRALLSAVPSLGRDGRGRIRLEGEPPDPGDPPSGCKFHPRCPLAQPICSQTAPELKEWLPGRFAACHFALADIEPKPRPETAT
ncbi:MAG: ATP-binding cassette domain-containing protein [Gaiellaceae bacterium MAG52_C11]|nr:ATP-binding cassette domain-containing protein [Candidatus Gaiellasilicea maunaloa]